MYFSSFPVMPYDSIGDYEFKTVTNILRRVALRSKVKTNVLVFDTYQVKEGETPEMVAAKLYNDPELHWFDFLSENYYPTHPSSALFLLIVSQVLTSVFYFLSLLHSKGEEED